MKVLLFQMVLGMIMVVLVSCTPQKQSLSKIENNYESLVLIEFAAKLEEDYHKMNPKIPDGASPSKPVANDPYVDETLMSVEDHPDLNSDP